MAQLTIAEVDGAAKRVYESAIKDLRPKSSILTNRASWEEGSRGVGEDYRVSVTLRPPNGFTHAGSAGTSRTALKAARPMVIKQASVTPFEIDLREEMLMLALSRLKDQGEGAVVGLFGEVMKGMKLSAGNRLEANVLTGQRGLGTVEAVTDLGSSQMDITITEATWRPGMWWALGEGTTLDSFTSTTKNNATAALVLAGVKASERKITVTHGGTFSSECAADDVLYFEGAYDGSAYYEMNGLLQQGSNTTGTSLGIAANTYGNWKGNTKSIGGNLTLDILEELCGELRDRGASGKLSAYMSNKTFAGLASQVRALRVVDSSYSSEKNKVGEKGLSFVSPEFGEIELVIHPFMAQGELYIQKDEGVGRVGSSDLTFGVPGVQSEKLFYVTPDYNTVEARLFSDQCIINKSPNHTYVATGITHT